MAEIIENLSEEEYAEMPGVRSTYLKTLLELTPRHMQWQLANRQEKPEFDVGNAAHAGILEHGKFSSRFVIAEQCCAMTQKGKRCANSGSSIQNGRWYCGTHDPCGDCDNVTVLTEKQFDAARGMIDSVQCHPIASKLLAMEQKREIAVFWTDEETGIACKARADVLIPCPGIILDIKTTAKPAHAAAFSGTICDYLYDFSAAFYMRGFAAAGIPIADFRHIPVEKNPPHLCAVWKLPESWLVKADTLVGEALRRYAAIDKAQVEWQGYPSGTREIDEPYDMGRRMERLLQKNY